MKTAAWVGKQALRMVILLAAVTALARFPVAL